MKSHRLALLTLLALAVTALVLGTVGGADATSARALKAKITKIANQVVTDRAASLSVAHASTADTAKSAQDAAKLAGQPPSAYQTSVFSYNTVDQGGSQVPSAAKQFTFPGLPAGTYLLTYDVNAHFVTGTAAMQCSMQTVSNHPQPLLARSYGTGATDTTNSAAFTVVVTADSAPKLNCGASASNSTFIMELAQSVASDITFVRVDNPQFNHATVTNPS